ncbi:heavy metal sensor kinase [Halanaerobium saccharolyticum]|uniref:histidine kinase n=1 Tax=Halanaerobium saccharolyticum TaxID=43595 RepID=A0A4R6LHR1_9FIRM|nr:ATP-binding protein [Halanaerobium saccharolyticum]TDO83422.1 heavy metal sensor kinase [Halanaerobium saccharolyticum]
MSKNFNYKKYPLKINLTIWYMIILFLVLIFFSSILYFYLEKQLKEEVHSILKMEMQNIKSEVRDPIKIGSDPLRSINNQNIKSYFINSQGKLISKHTSSDFIKNLNLEAINKFKIIEYNNQKWAVLAAPYDFNDSRTTEMTGFITLLYSFAREERVLDKLVVIFLIMIPLTLILASGGGYFLANRALKAIDIISATAEKISQKNLSQRIKISANRENEVGRLVKTLNNLLDRLENSFYRQKQFNADVSHELKTPVSVIKAQVDEALDSEEKLTVEQKDILLTIKKHIVQMNNLISQMLLLAKADEKNIKLDKEKFDLNIVVDTVIEEMNNLALEKNISIIKKTFGKQDFKIKADLSLITQLLLNLIDNAVKYTKSEGEIKVILTTQGSLYKINIIDDGIGIEEEELDNIFKRFYRVDKSRSREYGGTGLGLSICSWIVKIHGGEIKVESSMKNGSNFSIILPKE